MKTIYSIILALFLAIGVQAQNCNWSATTSPNGTAVFIPGTGFPSPQYYAEWNFGDGTILHAPVNPITYVYQNPGIYLVCITIYDSLNALAVCSYCDSISFGSFGGCNITYTQNGSQFTFNASTTNPGSSVMWSFGDGTSGTGSPVTHTYNGIGNFTVTMTELDSNGTVICTSTSIISTQSGSTCSFVYSQPNPGTAPSTYQFAGTAGINQNITWDFGDGSSNVSGLNPQHIYAQAGTYNVCMTSISLIDTCITCQNITVSTATNPGNCSYVAFPDSSNTSNIFMSATGVNPNNTILWNFGDGSTGSGQFTSHQYNAPGVYLICLTEIDSSGNTICSFCNSYVVGSLVNCNFTYTGSGTVGSPMIYTAATIPGGSTYTWDFGDGTSAVNGQTVTHVYSSPGVYNVCLTVGQQGAVVCISCQPVVINGSATGCQANFVSVSLGLTAYFVDQSVVNNVNVPPTGVSYLWSFGDGGTSTLQFPNHQYSLPGSYVACLVVSAGGCTSTYCDSIVIDTMINNPIGCNAYFVFTQMSPFNLVGVNLSNGTNISFSWNFGDGSPLVNTAYPSHQYANTGTYVVCLTVADFLGCTDTYCDTLTVDSLGNIVYRGMSSGFVLNIYSPSTLTSGINDPIIKANPELYPNPATDLIAVKWSNEVSNDLNYKIFTVDGREILHGNLNRNANSISIESLSAGYYLLQVRNDNGSIEAKSFIKQ